jgi:hypothetical protein
VKMLKARSEVRWQTSGLTLAASLAVLSLISAIIVNYSDVVPTDLYSDPDAPSKKGVSTDDVNHDGALDGIFGQDPSTSHKARISKARKFRGSLSASSSIQDFMKAAMDGSFDNGKNVKLATDGLFGKSSLKPKSNHHARQQALAESNVFRKFQQSQKSRVRRQAHRPVPAWHHIAGRRSDSGEAGWKFPTEDKFVAQYTGSTPKGDVIVDRLVPGPYVPL